MCSARGRHDLCPGPRAQRGRRDDRYARSRPRATQGHPQPWGRAPPLDPYVNLATWHRLEPDAAGLNATSAAGFALAEHDVAAGTVQPWGGLPARIRTIPWAGSARACRA